MKQFTYYNDPTVQAIKDKQREIFEARRDFRLSTQHPLERELLGLLVTRYWSDPSNKGASREQIVSRVVENYPHLAKHA